MSDPRPDRTCEELRGLTSGLRDAWRFRLKPESLRTWQRAMKNLGFSMVVSRERFADVEGGVMASTEEGLHLVVVGRDREVARRCLTLELANVGRGAAVTRAQLAATIDGHRRLGRAYGYPSCCVEAFGDAHVEAVLADDAVGDNAVALLRATRRTVRFHPWLAALPSAYGVPTKSTLRHLPCRFDCEASVELAGRLLDDMKRLDARRHRSMVDGQRGTLWVDREGRIHAARPSLRTEPNDPFPLELPFGR